ncbi:MAG: NAD(P)-dependent oxidoreductase [Fibrobacterota bacterium]
MDVFFYEAFEEEAKALGRHLPVGVKAGFAWQTPQEAGHTAPPAPLISVRTQSVIPAAWAPKLRGILTRSTGYDHLARYRDTAGCPLPCGYLPLYCHRAVAEQALLLILALLRKLPLQTENFSRFHRDGMTGREAEKKRLLVLGVGNIGYEMVKLGKGLGMTVHGVDIVRRHPDVHYVTPEAGLPWADIIVCAMNLTPDNTGYFSYHTFKKTKPGLLFINVARGELSPASDLLLLLREGHLSGAGLDVYNNESELAVALRSGRASDDAEVRAVLELSKRADVLCTPHNAFNTAESVERKAEQSLQSIHHFLRHGIFPWPVP